MTGHAPFAPSAAERWLACPGSFALGLAHPPEPESEYAAEGTRLHKVAAAHLLAGDVDRAIQRDDYRFLKPYFEHVKQYAGNDWSRWIEQTIPHSALLFGTPDFMALNRSEDRLVIVD